MADDNSNEQMKASYIDEHDRKVIFAVSQSELDFRKWERKQLEDTVWLSKARLLVEILILLGGVSFVLWAYQNNVFEQFFQGLAYCRAVGVIR